MSDERPKPWLGKPAEWNPEYHRFIGLVASDWAALEYHINEAIWALAGVKPALGACMTTQIYTLDGRLKALLSLLKLRQAPKRLVERSNQFMEKSRGPQEIRNRIVHDPWALKGDGTGARLEITAKHRLKFGFKDVPLDELEADEAAIKALAIDARHLRDAVFAALPTLPEIPPEELEPIIPARSLRK